MQSLNMLIDQDKRGGCLTSPFLPLSYFLAGHQKEEKKFDFCKALQYQVPQWFTIHICLMKKKKKEIRKEEYKGE